MSSGREDVDKLGEHLENIGDGLVDLEGQVIRMESQRKLIQRIYFSVGVTVGVLLSSVALALSGACS